MRDERELVAALRRRDQSALTWGHRLVPALCTLWHQHLRHQYPEIEIIDGSLTGHKPTER